MPWVKGQSGNPAGGGAYGRHAIKFAEKLRAGPVDEALAALQGALQSGDGQVRVAAAKEILARGIGKPVDVNVTLADFSDDEIWAEMERRLQAKPAAPAQADQVRTQ